MAEVNGNMHNAEVTFMSMMTDNAADLSEYYVISKQQARRTLGAALFVCLVGLGIYLIGIIAELFFNKDISAIAVVGGTVVEIIAGLFFWWYRAALKQLEICHQRLRLTERYLTVIQIIKEMPEHKQADAYNELITSVLADNSKIIPQGKGTEKKGLRTN